MYVIFLEMVEYQLYGTYLTFCVEQIIVAANTPMTVKEVADELAQLPTEQQRNLVRRVRLSLNLLTDNGRIHRGSIRKENIISFTYSKKNYELERQVEESGQNG